MQLKYFQLNDDVGVARNMVQGELASVPGSSRGSVNSKDTTKPDSSLARGPRIQAGGTTLDHSIFELGAGNPSGYALLVFNVSCLNLQPGYALNWLVSHISMPHGWHNLTNTRLR